MKIIIDGVEYTPKTGIKEIYTRTEVEDIALKALRRNNFNSGPIKTKDEKNWIDENL